MLVEFTRSTGRKIAINADAVAWMEPMVPSGTAICISGKEGDILAIDMQYELAVEAIQDAMS